MPCILSLTKLSSLPTPTTNVPWAASIIECQHHHSPYHLTALISICFPRDYTVLIISASSFPSQHAEYPPRSRSCVFKRTSIDLRLFPCFLGPSLAIAFPCKKSLFSRRFYRMDGPNGTGTKIGFLFHFLSGQHIWVEQSFACLHWYHGHGYIVLYSTAGWQ